MRDCFLGMKTKRALAAFLAAVIVSAGVWSGAALPVHAEEAAGGSLNVAYHSKEEIAARMKGDALSLDAPVSYAVEPQRSAPYSNIGVLTQETLDNAMKMMNQIRFIAGLSDNVTLNEEYNRLAQAASMVNYANGSLSHYPSMPAGMDGEVYQLGYAGSSSSNLALGYSTLNRTIVQGWMEDGDSSNIDRVGHRRWILNPPMGQTGFGAVGRAFALYCFDWSNSSARQTQVAWPAQNMPVGYFSSYFPWSVSMDQYVEMDSVRVSLTRVNDGRTWNFSAAASDGYFNVNNTGYGQTGCIIFRPDGVGEYQDGDTFQVSIAGDGVNLSYTVNFFDPDLMSMGLPTELVVPVDWAAVNAAVDATPDGGIVAVLAGSRFAVPAETLGKLAGTNRMWAFHVDTDLIFCMPGQQMKPAAAPWDVRIFYRSGKGLKQGILQADQLLREGKISAFRAFYIEDTGSFPGSVNALINFGAEQAGKSVQLYRSGWSTFDLSTPQGQFTATAGGQAAFTINSPGAYLAMVMP